MLCRVEVLRLRNSTPYRNLVLSSKNATCVFGWNQFPKIAKGAHINIFCPQSHGPTPVFTACESRDKNSGDLRKLWASPDTSPDMIPLGVHAPRNLATSSLPDLEQKFSCKVGQSGLITASETLMSTEPQNFTKNVRITTAPHLQTQKSDEPGFLQVQSGLRRVSCSVGPTDRRKQIDHLQDPIASPGIWNQQAEGRVPFPERRQDAGWELAVEPSARESRPCNAISCMPLIDEA
ncbi:uncharacterized protein [Physcomitrium patens]|uniref:uncharacterized protein isoform X4 n=1 Tax=Physcomitrium patens TaxID=3218 RepID=UPI003CCD16F8